MGPFEDFRLNVAILLHKKNLSFSNYFILFFFSQEKKIQKRKQLRRRSKMLLNERITNEAPCNSYLQNEIVLATIPGFAPWPARVKNIIGETIYVEFFGTGQV